MHQEEHFSEQISYILSRKYSRYTINKKKEKKVLVQVMQPIK